MVLAGLLRSAFFRGLEREHLLDARERDLEVLGEARGGGPAEAQEARRFGILLSSKPGQGSAAVAERCAKELRSAGKEAWVLVMDFLAPEKLLGLKLDALVNVACPRIDEDTAFRLPVVNPSDLPAVLGKGELKLAAINNVRL